MHPVRENNRNVTVQSCAWRKYLKLSQEEPRLISKLPLVSLQQDFRSYGLDSHQLLIRFYDNQQDRKGQHTSYTSVLFKRHSSDLLLCRPVFLMWNMGVWTAFGETVRGRQSCVYRKEAGTRQGLRLLTRCWNQPQVFRRVTARRKTAIKCQFRRYQCYLRELAVTQVRCASRALSGIRSLPLEGLIVCQKNKTLKLRMKLEPFLTVQRNPPRISTL